MMILGLADVIECIDCVNAQVGELCTKAAQCSLPVQQLQKRLVLFRHHMEEVIPAAVPVISDDSLKTATRNVTNKQQLDKSNAKQKWYFASSYKTENSSNNNYYSDFNEGPVLNRMSKEDLVVSGVKPKRLP